MNRINLVGRITRNLELKQTPNGKFFVPFNLATNDYSGGKEIANYHDCIVWGQGAEFMNKYCGKGDLMEVIGTVRYRTYEAKDGHKVKATEIIADDVRLLAKNEKKKEPEVTNSYVNSFGFNDDDLPF